MKKTITLFAFLALAVCSQAATIKWTISGNTTYVINDVLGNAYASQTVYLLAGSDVSDITDSTQTKKDFSTALAARTIATATSSSTGTKPDGVTNLEFSSPLMTAGSEMGFAVLLLSEDEDFGYYKVFTATATPFADDAPAASRTGAVRSAWAANGIDKGSWTKTYAVPEPSVAIMGLLGLGMLLKRRRA